MNATGLLSGQAEYALAGHVPILHYRHRRRDTTRLSIQQFPLGLIPGGRYASLRITYARRDLFLMLTDGILGVPNDRGEEFGLTRPEQMLTQYAALPLPHLGADHEGGTSARDGIFAICVHVRRHFHFMRFFIFTVREQWCSN